MGTGEQLESDEPPAILVGPCVRGLTRVLLGGHVAWRAHPSTFGGPQGRRARAARRAVLRVVFVALRDPEIQELERAVCAHEHVVGLHVAVNEAALVRRAKRARRLE